MKDPAFLFYSSDFLTGTLLFSHEQKGKYITLLCLQHQKGHLSEKDMLSICFSYDEDVFAKFKKDEGGLYYNERLEVEANKRKNYTESRRINAQQPKKHIIKNKKTYAQHMENENENINEDVLGKIDFEIFWNLYDKKVGDKVKIKKKWAALPLAEQEKVLQYIPKYLESQPDKKYRKNPETFFNNKSWNDEIIKTETHATPVKSLISHSTKQSGALEFLEKTRARFAPGRAGND